MLRELALACGHATASLKLRGTVRALAQCQRKCHATSCAGRTKVHVTGSALLTGPPGRVRLKRVDTAALGAQVSLPVGVCAPVLTSAKLHAPLCQPQQPGAADTLMFADCARARARIRAADNCVDTARTCLRAGLGASLVGCEGSHTP